MLYPLVAVAIKYAYIKTVHVIPIPAEQPFAGLSSAGPFEELAGSGGTRRRFASWLTRAANDPR
jgi:hypothetical protein